MNKFMIKFKSLNFFHEKNVVNNKNETLIKTFVHPIK